MLVYARYLGATEHRGDRWKFMASCLAPKVFDRRYELNPVDDLRDRTVEYVSGLVPKPTVVLIDNAHPMIKDTYVIVVREGD